MKISINTQNSTRHQKKKSFFHSILHIYFQNCKTTDARLIVHTSCLLSLQNKHFFTSKPSRSLMQLPHSSDMKTKQIAVVCLSKVGLSRLKHCRKELAAIFHASFSNQFSFMKIAVVLFKFIGIYSQGFNSIKNTPILVQLMTLHRTGKSHYQNSNC